MGVKIEPKQFTFTDYIHDKALKDIKKSTLENILKGLR